MSTYSLDTDTITKLLKKHPGNQPVVDRLRREIQRNSLFVICPVVYYEVRRGLLFKSARTQLVAFEKLVESARRGLALPSFLEAIPFINQGRASPTPTHVEGFQCAHLGPSLQPVVRPEGTRALP
jgi:predicted nucleic acid-binding protein